MMLSSRAWKRLGLAAALLVVAALLGGFWAVPAVIRAQLAKRYGGHVAFSGWWVGGSSAGVTGLALNEGPGADSPVWARAERVETDLSLSGFLKGRFAPGKITLFRPQITFRLDADGKPLTRPPLKGGDSSPEAALPIVEVRGGQLTIHQDGRPEMKVGPIAARLASAEGGEALNATTDDPTWGRWSIGGRFDPGFASGRIELTSGGALVASPEKTAMIPFVPASVWEQISPSGPMRVSLVVTTGADPTVVTRGEFLGMTLKLGTLGIVAEKATGRMTIDGRTVTLEGLKGQSLGGSMSADGSMDFAKAPPRIDLTLGLTGVDVAKTPASWQLAESGIAGKLTGSARLRIAMKPDGADLTGSEGNAVVEGATISGVAVKSLKLAMKAEGSDLKYETGDAGASILIPALSPPRERADAGGGGVRGQGVLFDQSRESISESRVESRESGAGSSGQRRVPLSTLDSRLGDSFPGSALCPLLAHDHARDVRPAQAPGDRQGAPGPLTRPPLKRRPPSPSGGRGQEKIPPLGALPLAIIALQSPPAQQPKPSAPPKPKSGGFVLPKSLSTELEFADVDLTEILAKAHALGIPLPFAVTGRLSVKAKATIPLGALRDVKAYTFHGQATLRRARVAGVHLRGVSARLDLENGVLDLTDFRGRLVEKGEARAPAPRAGAEIPAPDAPLPSGGFRGRLHAEISPPGRLAAHFEANQAPLAEMTAPALPEPNPLSGHATFAFDAEADVAHLDDPARWSISGKAEAEKITYQGATLDRVSASLSLKDGRAAMPDFAASLGGQPLRASAEAGAAPPYDFAATLDVKGWDLGAILAFVPSVPRPAPAGGGITMTTTARGTLRPTKVEIRGEGRLSSLRAGPVMIGDVPLKWTTDGDVIRLAIAGAHPFGGTISAEAAIPARGDGPIAGSASFRDLDLAAASAGMPELPLSGRASGKGSFVVRPQAKGDEPPVEGDLSLAAPDLSVRGIPARSLQAVVMTKGHDLHYDAFAEGLGGKFKFAGVVPLVGPSPPNEATGSLQAVGFRLGGLWPAVAPSLKGLDGLAAIDANLLAHRDGTDLRARGVAEVRDLRWGPHVPIGGARGTFTRSPSGWRIEPLSGDIFGGSARGSVASDGAPGAWHELRFDLEIARASLRKASAFLPAVSGHIEGEGTFRVAGRMADALRADGEFSVPSARLYGLPLLEFRAPGELDYAPGGGSGALRLRRWSARFAGGRLGGDARLGFGVDRSFQADTQLTAIDLESLLRVLTDSRKPASGKVSGKIALGGPEPDRVDRYRGRIDLDLDDASVIELPVFRELDRFLGSSRGGIFEDGDVHAVIANRQAVIESMTLEGRLVQVHVTGTVGFDQQLNLEVLANTNQIISQTGQALVGLVPGLSEASGRRNLATSRFASYLGTRLLKFRVTGTLASPSVNLDPAIAVTEGAAGFFAGALKLPLDLLR